MNKVAAGRKLAEELYAAEAAVDEAYAAIARLAEGLSRTRKALGLAAPVGAGAFSAVGDAMGRIAAAREDIVRAHGELARVQRRTGLDAVDFGAGDKLKEAPEETVRRIA